MTTENKEWKITLEIIRLCEYAYRLGVNDGAICNDSICVNNFCDVPIPTKSFSLLNDNKEMNISLYLDMICVCCGKIKAHNLSDHIRMRTKSISSHIRAYAILFDFKYKQGLKHGIECGDLDKCINFFRNVNNGHKHERLLHKGNWSKMSYLDEQKHHCNVLAMQLGEQGEHPYTSALSLFIGVAASKYYQDKY